MQNSSEHALIEAIDIPLWLEADRVRDWRARVARDRAIAADLGVMTVPPSARVLAWWHALERDDDEKGLGRQIVLLFRRLTMVIMLLGALSGGGLASAVLFYDGRDPINVLAVLGWLVGLPLVLLTLSLVLTLSSRWGREANIGAFVLAFLQRHNRAANAFFSTHSTIQARDRLLRWQLLRTSQWGGLAFSVAALAVLLVKVGFSDLAFAWSTTLSIETHSLANAVRYLAWPWHAWLPQAIPSFELIDHSRYFRLNDETTGLQAETLTAWWRFLALCLGVYTIGIRLLVLVIATVGFRRATTHLLIAHTEVSALLDRFDTPSITTEAEVNETSAPHSNQTAPLFSGTQSTDLVILWHGAGRTTMEETATPCIEAGELSLDEDLATLRVCTLPAGGSVRIMTKAWEPPMFEFHDYLGALREVFGKNVSLVVEPLGEDGVLAPAADLTIWRRSLGHLGDARVYLK